MWWLNIGTQTIMSTRVLKVFQHLKKKAELVPSLYRQVKHNHNGINLSSVCYLSCLGHNKKLGFLFKDLIETKNVQVSTLVESLAESNGNKKDGSNVEMPIPLVLGFDVLLKTYIQLGRLDHAVLALFEMTKKGGFLPHVWSCNFILNCFIDNGKFDRVVDIFEELKKLGLKPNVSTYGIVVKGLCKRGDLDGAFVVFKEMEGLGITPDAFVHMTLIDGLSLKGKTSVAYEMLQACRGGIKIDASGYNAIIRGYCREMKLQEADGVLQDMRKHGVSPNAYSYGSLIHGYCHSGQVLKALALHDEMLSKGVKSNSVILSYILQCLCKMGMDIEYLEHFKFSGQEDWGLNLVLSLAKYSLLNFQNMDLYLRQLNCSGIAEGTYQRARDRIRVRSNRANVT